MSNSTFLSKDIIVRTVGSELVLKHPLPFFFFFPILIINNEHELSTYMCQALW